MKYPIGIQSFDQIIEDGYVYVDKTEMIYSLVKEGKIYFLSRPRRFGKSLLLSTLKNYFLGRKELFKGLAIDRLEKDWLEYPVFHIDFNGSDFQEEGTLEKVIEEHISAWEKAYAILPDQSRDRGMRFIQVLREAHARVGRRAVVLIDEYDKPILDVLDTGLETVVGENRMSLEDRNRGILKGFYSVFKAADEHLQFVLLTGVTKFSQVSVFSGFNQPRDISMDEQFESLCGITGEELESYFAISIEELARKNELTVEEMKQLVKAQYDGYHFGTGLIDIYNPFSLLNAFISKRISDYWFQSGTPTYLVRLLRHTRENLDEMTGRYYRTPEFVDYKADVEKPLPMIYQSGYLTIKAYDERFQIYTLGFPNDEVKYGFLNFVTPFYTPVAETETSFYISKFIRELREGDPDAFLTRLRAFFAGIPYELNDRTERHYQTVFYLVFKLMGQFSEAEVRSAKGRADAVVKTDDYIYVFEFKLDGSADEALAQIDNRGYLIPYTADDRKLVKIGVNFDPKERNIGEWCKGKGF